MDITTIDAPAPAPIEGTASLLSFWWGCIEAGYELEHHDKRLPDDTLILHYCANGTTCMVFARDVRAAMALLKGAA
jgi:hypothetical protein